MLEYAICSTPRSGGNLLCDLLRQTGIAGDPEEWIHHFLAQKQMAEWKAKPCGLYRRIREHRAKDDVFGILLHWREQIWLKEIGVLKEDYWELFQEPSPRVIFLTREDKIQQAVSWWIAAQTDVWKRTSQSENRQGVKYCREQIEQFVTWIDESNAAWENWFVEHSVNPLRVTYERLINDREETVRQVLDYLGLKYERSIPNPTLQKQANQLNDQFCERYKNEQRVGQAQPS